MMSIKIKELKSKSRKVLKSNYLLLISVCLFAAFLGSEFTDSLIFTELDTAFFKEFITIPNSVIEAKDDILGSGKGILSDIVSSVGSGSILDALLIALTSIIGSQGIASVIVILLGLSVIFLFWFFTANVFPVASRRIFLESRIYIKTNVQRILFLHHTKKWKNAAWSMFVKFFYNTCWYLLFIIGGLIKRYSYFLVPYILAENPSIKATDAINLSRKMMDGYKWYVFKLELSFIGWFFLKIITLGLSGLFYSNAYKTGTITEFYVELRNLSIKNKIHGIEVLDDKYLYELPSNEVIDKEYKDIKKDLEKDIKIKNLKPIEKILGYIGITLRNKKMDNKIEKDSIKKEVARGYIDTLEKEKYPMRLSKFKVVKNNENLDALVKYTIPTLILFFFIFSFVGWFYEVMLHVIRDNEFVNRGALFGPWLPIYGSGGVLILLVLYKLRKNPLIQFISAVVLCGVLEYLTSYILEMTHNGMKWWDYSGYLLNINGRVCAEGLLVFGLGGMAVVYIIAPLINKQIKKINPQILIIIITVLITLFVTDLIYSSINPNTGDGITTGYNYIINPQNI